MDEDIKDIKAALQQTLGLLQQLKNRTDNVELKAQEHADALEKLGKVTGLEYSQDIRDWCSIEKLKALKENPR